MSTGLGKIPIFDRARISYSIAALRKISWYKNASAGLSLAGLARTGDEFFMTKALTSHHGMRLQTWRFPHGCRQAAIHQGELISVHFLPGGFLLLIKRMVFTVGLIFPFPLHQGTAGIA